MTIFEAYNNCKKQLEAAGIEDYVFEAKQIIKHITGLTNAQILVKYMNELTLFQENNLTAIIKQRKIRYPLQYILGKWNFFGRDFFVGTGVLIPRSDTETLIDVCLESLPTGTPSRALDLCAGTGCVGITLACERTDCKVTLVEKYDQAYAYTKKNAKYNNADVQIVKGDVLIGEGGEGEYDLIVSNPPYIADEDMKNLQPEVEFEPSTALSGGEDGLMFYREILKNYKKNLKSGGVMAFEVGLGQAESVCALMAEHGFINITKRADASSIDRVVFGTAD